MANLLKAIAVILEVCCLFFVGYCFTLGTAQGVVALFIWLALVASIPSVVFFEIAELFDPKDGASSPISSAGDQDPLVGTKAVAKTPLKPIGVIRVGKDEMLAISQFGYVNPGTEVVILGRDGNEYLVKETGNGEGE